MSTTSKRDTPPREGGSVDHRLARLLDAPSFARVVPHLAPEMLHQLIQYRGLESCGELVASATPAQLNSLLDLDLWRAAQPGLFGGAQGGRDEQFDVDRFGEWLEVLVDTGDSVAARTVAALDQQLVIAGLSRYLRVFDPGTFEPTESSDDERVDRHEKMNSETGADVLECEVGGYLLRARRADAWDALVALLVTLEAEQYDSFHALMRECRRLSNSTPEVDGLDDLLMTPEQHRHDVAVERERRRSQQGYATPADARAFLQMARHPPHTRVAANPIATAYFRAADEQADAASQDTSGDARVTAREPAAPACAKPPATHGRGDDDIRTSIEAVIELLAEAGIAPERRRALLAAAGQDPRSTDLDQGDGGPAKLTLLKRLMEFVLHHDETAYFTRSRELAFLANTLLAGASVQSRPFTRREASDAASCICNLGLECWPARWPGATSPRSSPPRESDAMPPDAFLVDRDLVTAFEVGWSVLHQDVSLFVADQLQSTLADLPCGDDDTRRGLLTLRRTLEKQRQAGTPWLARDAAEVLAMLDTTAWISVLGLLDECPIVPAALTAVLERRTTLVSPTAFEFISTTAQIGDIRLFMRKLPVVLSP